MSGNDGDNAPSKCPGTPDRRPPSGRGATPRPQSRRRPLRPETRLRSTPLRLGPVRPRRPVLRRHHSRFLLTLTLRLTYLIFASGQPDLRRLRSPAVGRYRTTSIAVRSSSYAGPRGSQGRAAAVSPVESKPRRTPIRSDDATSRRLG